MAGEWSHTTLGDVIELKRGYDLPGRERRSGDVPIVSSSGPSGLHCKAMVKAPGVVTGRYGTIGEVFYVERDFWPLNTTLYVRDFKGNHPRFVAYFLKLLRFDDYSDKGAVPGVNRNHLHMAPVLWPGVEEQRHIADLLSSLDDKIALNRRMAGTLEGIARTLFQSWFIDFDPVRRAAAGSDTGLPVSIAALFSNILTPNGVPEGWTMGTVSKFAAINPTTKLGGAPTAPYVDMAALPTSGPRITRVTQRPPGSGARFVNNDTLIARITPCLENGKTAFVDCLPHGAVGWGSTEFIVLRPHANIPRALPYLIARHEPFRAHLIAAMSGTSGRQRVQADAVDSWKIAIPPAPILRAVDELLDPIFDRLKALGEESDTVTALRDTLLPKLLSGELRVRDAETIAAST
jgi:type I restriction enzyme S subunit